MNILYIRINLYDDCLEIDLNDEENKTYLRK